MRAFAISDDITMPKTEEHLKAHLGPLYRFEDWKPAFDAVFSTENDTAAAIAIIDKLTLDALGPPSSHSTSHPNVSRPSATMGEVTVTRPFLPQLEELEINLMRSVSTLQERKRVRGTAPTLEDLLNPMEETTIGNSPYSFPGGDDEIIAEAVQLTNGEPDPTEDSDDPDNEGEEDSVSVREGLVLCEQLDKLCLRHPDADGVSILVLQQQLRKFRVHLHHLEANSQKQTTLDAFWGERAITIDVDMD
jgi:hypothetical protein